MFVNNIKNELWTYSYGLCVFSLETLQVFLKSEKVKSKKLLNVMQKDDSLFLETQKQGIWLPIPQINSGNYLVKVQGIDEEFDEEWEKKFTIEGFNIEIGDGLWITDIGAFQTFEKEKFGGNEVYSDKKNGMRMYYGIKYEIPSGKYLVSISGYAKIDKVEFPGVNNGFAFSLTKVDEFEGYKNSREDIYDFNVAEM